MNEQDSITVCRNAVSIDLMETAARSAQKGTLYKRDTEASVLGTDDVCFCTREQLSYCAPLLPQYSGVEAHRQLLRFTIRSKPVPVSLFRWCSSLPPIFPVRCNK